MPIEIPPDRLKVRVRQGTRRTIKGFECVFFGTTDMLEPFGTPVFTRVWADFVR